MQPYWVKLIVREVQRASHFPPPPSPRHDRGLAAPGARAARGRGRGRGRGAAAHPEAQGRRARHGHELAGLHRGVHADVRRGRLGPGPRHVGGGWPPQWGDRQRVDASDGVAEGVDAVAADLRHELASAGAGAHRRRGHPGVGRRPSVLLGVRPRPHGGGVGAHKRSLRLLAAHARARGRRGPGGGDVRALIARHRRPPRLVRSVLVGAREHRRRRRHDDAGHAAGRGGDGRARPPLLADAGLPLERAGEGASAQDPHLVDEQPLPWHPAARIRRGGVLLRLLRAGGDGQRRRPDALRGALGPLLLDGWRVHGGAVQRSRRADALRRLRAGRGAVGGADTPVLGAGGELRAARGARLALAVADPRAPAAGAPRRDAGAGGRGHGARVGGAAGVPRGAEG
mmetsp:Transcript_89439/g.250266  ORF Transcript_89439/g.250266 Transcript_89439/m.250266 type:complete len:399 (+) Transcript_89439:2-1198(+)